MELGLRLGECSKQACFKHVGLGLNTTLSIGPNPTIISTKTCSDEEDNQDDHHHEDELEEEEEVKINDKKKKQENHEEVVAMNTSLSLDNDKNKNKLQLHLLPPTPVLPLSSFPWPPNSDHGNYSGGGGGEVGGYCSRLPASSAAGEEDESEGRAAVTSSSSPNSAASSFQVDLCTYNNKLGRRETLISRSGNNGNNNNYNYNYYHEQKGRRCSSSRGGITMSDEDDNVVGGGTRKKLRLSKQQSAFLEDTFKQHSTLNPKQKVGVAKELNLRPRQVEVWFQNRRARTKLKQTEVECEYLKRCCERISEENKRLHKELEDLRALKASSSNPFFMQLPPTTLTMCPSCERVQPNPTTSSNNNTSNHSKPNFFPFPHSKPHHHQP